MKRTYDTTVARMAGNIASGLIGAAAVRGLPMKEPEIRQWITENSVTLARDIVAEVERTEPAVIPLASGTR